MNQPFQELAERAGFKLIREYCYDVVSTMSVQEFAELIVRECVKEIGYKSVDLLDIDFYPHYQERLKKHFGVKE